MITGCVIGLSYVDLPILVNLSKFSLEKIKEF